MGLEKTLAEIQVLSKELDERVFINWKGKGEHIFQPYVFVSLPGIAQNAKLIFNKYHSAKKVIGANKSLPEFSCGNYGPMLHEASTYLSEMAMDCKNLADNLNIFIQTVYGEDFKGDLNTLEKNSQSAPPFDDGKTVYDRFSEAHIYSKDSLLKLCRDSKGHLQGHSLLYIASFNPLELRLQFTNLKTRKFFKGPDAVGFLDYHANSYLEMARDVLQIIADKDKGRFRERKTNRKYEITKQRAKNFYQRHSKPIALVLGSTLLTAGLLGGSLGTIAYQNYQKQKGMQNDVQRMSHVMDYEQGFELNYDNWRKVGVEVFKKELIEERKFKTQEAILTYPHIAGSYDLKKVFGTESNLFDKAVGDLQEESKNLGGSFDRAISRASTDPSKVVGYSREFLDKRAEFRKKVNEFYSTQKGIIPNVDSIELLDELIQEKKALCEMESGMAGLFQN